MFSLVIMIQRQSTSYTSNYEMKYSVDHRFVFKKLLLYISRFLLFALKLCLADPPSNAR